MMPEEMPKVSLITLTTGARQFVVQLALEMTLCLEASYLSSLTPRTTVMSSFVAGAGMITFLTVERGGALAFWGRGRRLWSWTQTGGLRVATLSCGGWRRRRT